ncbi:MAG: hypothetical protein WC791_04225 [Candidatus Paceibacterota bacterium]|jgi:hypothetical protein
MRKRIIVNLVLLGAVIYLPWWAVMVIASIAAFLCAPYYEIVAFGVLFDILYGTNTISFGGVIGLVASVCIFVLANIIGKRIR